MLSMGRFETEIDVLTHGIIKECLRYFRLIVENDDDESLVTYAEVLTKIFIKEQMKSFPNAQRVTDH